MPSEPARNPSRRRLGLGLGLAFAAASVLPALWIVNRLVPPPSTPGLENGRLRACPDSPNCVVSENSDARHAIDAIAFKGVPEVAMARFSALLDRYPGCRLMEQRPGYIRCEFRTRICRFVDDVEFRLDADAGVIHVRSASRLGYSDLGTNRRRVESLRQAMAVP